MQSSFENFQDKFLEEALDNINDLEQALLELELSPGNKDLLEKVFRVMHSLKGGGAMFGFDKLSEFTHRMENIYDMVRSGKLSVSQNLLSVTLASVDMLRDLLDLKEIQKPKAKKKYKNLVSEIDLVVRQETEKMITAAVQDDEVLEEEDDQKMATYYIHFYPGKHVLESGTNLLYLLDELAGVGSMFTIPRNMNVPDLSKLEPTQSYVFWDIFLSTDVGKNAILDVFMFVEDESVIELHKIGDFDLFSNEGFVQRLNEINVEQGEIELSDFTEFIGEEQAVLAANAQNSLPVEVDEPEENGKNRFSSASSIRVSSEKIDGLMNLVSELVITQERLNSISAKHQIPELKMVTENVQKLTGMLRDSAFSISLIPVENMLTRFHRLVRDLSGKLGKPISFSATGTETELDKTMIESLTDPLLHIIRNSIDHGIEMPEQRKKAGTPDTGRICLEAGYSGANVVIKIIDDGAGIDPEKIRKKAVDKGLIPTDSQPSKEELLNMVFMSGFSTSNEVTEVSGRGVGMDVVKRNISAIRGEVNVDSVIGKGTTITITLPLVLSIIDGLLVQIGLTQYVLPLSLTDRIYPISAKELEDNFIDVITLDGRQVPFFNLRKELNLKGETPVKSQAVTVNHSGMQIALSVDHVVGKIQAVLKPLGRLYHDQKMISAATIMGDGSIALVLDINTIVKQLLNQN